MAHRQLQYYGHDPILYDEFMVESESDLANLPDCMPGATAFTADYKSVWQMGLDGQWATVEEPAAAEETTTTEG